MGTGMDRVVRHGQIVDMEVFKCRFTHPAFKDLLIILKSGILSPPSLILPIVVECLILGGFRFHMKFDISLFT